MKILVVITTAFTSTGGLTTVMMNYYRAMNKEGLKIDFASTNVPSQSLLDEIHVEGIKTNIELHQAILRDPAFNRGGTNIHYLEQEFMRKR